MTKLLVAAFIVVSFAVHTSTVQAADEALAARLEKSRAPILAAAKKIDQLVQAKWDEHDIRPSLPINDKIFMRRVYLDITGTIPSGQEALDFLNAKDKNKRQILIDYLLASEGYASHHYNYWADVLRIKSAGNNVELHGYVQWVKQALKENKPYDEFVYELLTATGKPYENGAVGYYLRDQGMPLDNLSNTVSVFLGTQIGCAQCHDHPFERWTQRDFYEMAAFTFSVDTRATGKEYQQQRRGVNEEIAKRKLSPQERQLVLQLTRYNQWNLKDADKTKQLRFPKDYDYSDVKPNSLVTPKTIFGDKPELRDGQSRREAFAEWATSKDNPLFAKVIANRLWKKVMGVGLIEPLDDIEGAKASNEELMDFLTYAMVRLDFNMKQYLRMLMNTEVYQRRAVYREVSDEPFYYPGPTLRRMTAEQLWDSLVTLSMDDPLGSKYEDNSPYRFPYYDLSRTSPATIVDKGLELYKKRQNRGKSMMMSSNKKPTGPNLARASEMRQPAPTGHFLRDFGASDRELVEGSNQDPTVSQILTLINGKHHYQIVREGSQLMELLAKAGKDNKLRARIIYLSILGREPSSTESRLAYNVFEQAKQPYRGNRELIWILLNTPEFMFIQ